MGYRVGQDEVRTRIIAAQDGVKHEMVHAHREPTSEQLKEFQRASAVAVLAEGGAGARYGDAEEKIWDAIILRVEGYEDADGKDLMLNANWKGFVPLTHKVAVINQIGNVWIPKGPESKNSASASRTA